MPANTTNAVNQSILKVFDLEKQAWRSMRKDRITQWELYE